jgi:uncharacterized protein
MEGRSAIWRRLDVVGMDSCRIFPSSDGWCVDGAAVFNDGGIIASLSYSLRCAKDWSSKSAQVSGWAGSRAIKLKLKKTAEEGWLADGHLLEGMSELLDIDLGFTPASNTNAIRRLGLEVGEETETIAVWLDTEDWSIKPLRQVYRCLSRKNYGYSSPIHNYHADLEVDDFGIVVKYPGLWQLENLALQ